MEPRTVARLHALGRVGFGLALALRPGPTGEAWIGPAGARPAAQVVTVAVGARDLGLGLGTLRALGAGAGARPWLLAGVLADAADAAATVRGRGHLSPVAVGAVGALGAGSALVGLWLQRELD